MANKIIIPAYKVSTVDLKKSIPNGRFKKLIFQCALKELKNNDAIFSVVAFAGNRSLGKWKYGKQVDCVLDPGLPDQVFDLANYPDPVSIGNNEIYQSSFTLKQKAKLGAKNKLVKQDNLMKKIHEISKDPVKSKTHFLTFSARINSPLSFDITIDNTSAATNPCPPNQPDGG